MNGWIQFHRQIMEHWVWQDQKQGYRWAELMMLAAWKSETVVYRNCRIEVQRGQLVTSIRALARRWKTNNRVVSSFIKILEGTKMIECDRTNKQWLIITISNYIQCTVFNRISAFLSKDKFISVRNVIFLFR